MKLSIVHSLLLLLSLHSAAAVRLDITAACRRLGTLANYLRTDPDMCLTWFGRPPNPERFKTNMNRFLNEEYKHMEDGTTVLDLVTRFQITPISGPKNRVWWAAISEVFAAQALGDVRAVVGVPPAAGANAPTVITTQNYMNTIFYQKELAQLTDPGSGVDKIISVNAANPVMKAIIWQRGLPGMGNWGLGGTEEDRTPSGIFLPPGCPGGPPADPTLTTITKRTLLTMGGGCSMPPVAAPVNGVGGRPAAVPVLNNAARPVPAPRPQLGLPSPQLPKQQLGVANPQLPKQQLGVVNPQLPKLPLSPGVVTNQRLPAPVPAPLPVANARVNPAVRQPPLPGAPLLRSNTGPLTPGQPQPGALVRTGSFRLRRRWAQRKQQQ